MFKTNNKSIVYSLGILAILAFGVIIMPREASALYNTGYQNRTQLINTPPPVYQNYPDPVQYYPAPIIYQSYPAQTSQTSTSTTTETTVEKENTTVEKSTTEESEESEKGVSDLAAGAIFGTNSFVPSGLVQWILLAILILLIVILVRKITGTANKYHSEPLKHA